MILEEWSFTAGLELMFLRELVWLLVCPKLTLNNVLEDGQLVLALFQTLINLLSRGVLLCGFNVQLLGRR